MPAERLWALSNEALANALFQEIEEVEEALEERCIGVLEHSEPIRELTNYHWWPQAAWRFEYPSPGFGISLSLPYSIT
jgi:hypothetical protein